MGAFRSWLYRNGLRPVPGSFFYSPSLAMIYAIQDSKKLNREWHLGFIEGVKQLELFVVTALDNPRNER